ncbi:MAG TPA: hypothetical protein VHW23_15990 [Kofleriaceae bacterium]|nr:hypothetical protein [Kofleriaceae bacterium]
MTSWRRAVCVAVLAIGASGALALAARSAAACVPTPWGGPCIGGAPSHTSSGSSSSSGGGGGGGGEPAPPSGMLLSPQQRLEKRGFDAASDCSGAIDHRDLERAIERCREALEAYHQAFGSTSARADEASRLLAFAQNALAGERLRSGRCGEAVALYQEAARTDPSTGGYARNLAGMQCRAQTAAGVASDLRLAPPPPPVAHRLVGAAIPLAMSHDVPPPAFAPDDAPRWSELAPVIELRGALAGARSAYRTAVPMAGEFVKDATFGVAAAQAGHGAPAILGFADRVGEARATGAQYRQLARDLVDELAGAAHETVSILGGGAGSAEHVLDTPERMAHMVDQFAAERTAASIWSEIKAWGTGRIHHAVKTAGDAGGN